MYPLTDPAAGEQPAEPDGEQADAVSALLPAGRRRTLAAFLVVSRAAKVFDLSVASARRHRRSGAERRQRRDARRFQNGRTSGPQRAGQLLQVQGPARQVPQSARNGPETVAGSGDFITL